MRLSELVNIISDTGVPCCKWALKDPDNTPLPHAVAAKVGSAEGLYADNENLYPVSRYQLFLAMYDDENQEDTEEQVDKALSGANINFTYEIGYDRNENIVVKVYTFSLPDTLPDN